MFSLNVFFEELWFVREPERKCSRSDILGAILSESMLFHVIPPPLKGGNPPAYPKHVTKQQSQYSGLK